MTRALAYAGRWFGLLAAGIAWALPAVVLGAADPISAQYPTLTWWASPLFEHTWVGFALMTILVAVLSAFGIAAVGFSMDGLRRERADALDLISGGTLVLALMAIAVVVVASLGARTLGAPLDILPAAFVFVALLAATVIGVVYTAVAFWRQRWSFSVVAVALWLALAAYAYFATRMLGGGPGGDAIRGVFVSFLVILATAVSFTAATLALIFSALSEPAAPPVPRVTAAADEPEQAEVIQPEPPSHAAHPGEQPQVPEPVRDPREEPPHG